MPNGSQIWQKGPDIPDLWISYSNVFNEFLSRESNGVTSEHAHKISEQELIIVRGDHILRFNIKYNVWDVFCHLKVFRHDTSSFIFGGKLYITGGQIYLMKTLPYTEIVDLDTKVSFQSISIFSKK